MSTASICINGDKRYGHLRYSYDYRLLSLLFGKQASRVATELRRMSFGQIPRKDENVVSLEEICSAYLAALDEHKAEPSDETTKALAAAKAPLVGRLRASYRKRLKALGCVFHLHDDGKVDGISVDRVMARRYRETAPALIKAFV